MEAGPKKSVKVDGVQTESKKARVDLDEDGASSESEKEEIEVAPVVTVQPTVTKPGLIQMRRVKYLVYLSYLGRGFNGFQKQYNQPGLITVQDVIERALGSAGFHRVYMTTGSRTDKGVNAYRHPIVVDVEDPPEVALGH